MTDKQGRLRDVAPSGEPWVSIAAGNGIRADTFRKRVKSGMSPGDAATRPPGSIRRRSQWVDVALGNGIKADTFYARVRQYGMSQEEAATRLPGRPRSEWVDMAEGNGIKSDTFYTRVQRGMSEEEAATRRTRRYPPRGAA